MDSVRQRGNHNRDAVNSLACTRSGGNRTGNHIGSRNSRGNVNAACMRTILPCVSHIARPTSLVSIQRDMFASADSRLGSHNLYVGTEGRNCERSGGQLTTLTSLNRHRVNTSRNRVGSTNRTVAPCERTHYIGMSQQSRRIILTNHIVTSDCNRGRSLGHCHGKRIGSNCRYTTLSVDSLSGEVVRAIVREVDRQVSLILTRDLNTILVPNVTSGVAISVDRNLIVLTNNRTCKSCQVDSVRQRGNHNRDAVNSLACTRSGGNRTGNHIGSRNSRGNVNAACMRTILPCVSHIARPTSLVSIQRDMLASADSRLGSHNLYARTEGRNCERSGGHFATLSRSHRHCVNTSRNRVRSTNSTVAPCERTRHIGVSRQNCRVVLTNHIVTTDSNCGRSRSNRNRNRSRSHCRDTTFRIDSLGREVVDTIVIHINSQLALVLTRNLNTIQIPDITGLCSRSSIHNSLIALTNSSRRRRDCQLARKFMNDNRDAVNSLASTASRSNRTGHHISGRFRRLNINAACMRTILPCVSHIACPAIFVSIQRNVFASAD